MISLEPTTAVAFWTATADAVKPFTDAFTTNLGMIVPVGIGVMAALVGVSLIPKVIYRFL